MNWFAQNQRAGALNRWIERRDKKGVVVTADELIARIRRNWPSATEAEIDALYQACG